MAKKVDELPAPTRAGKYAWDEWLDGDVWELTRGEDFETPPKLMQSAIHSAARARGGHADTRVVGEKVYLEFKEGKRK
jgi:hypothetical protein